MLKLVRPTAELKEAALEYKYEHFEYGDKEINGSETGRDDRVTYGNVQG